MSPFEFPITQYLKRIGRTGPPRPDADWLNEIHTAQVFSIPFENLDIHLGRSISLKPEDLVEKLLHRNRGGYCFELNELLRMALKAAGFAVRPFLARVLYQRREPGPFTHEGLLVAISGQDWLCDTGFGGPGLRSPIPLVAGRIFEQFGERFLLKHTRDNEWILQKKTDSGFLDLYMFQDLPVLDIDIEMSNHFTSTWPSSIFRLHRMCARPNPTGRVTLLDMELAIHEGEWKRNETLPDGIAYMEALSEYFRISLDAEYEDFIL